jgi:hypothetical protein
MMVKLAPLLLEPLKGSTAQVAWPASEHRVRLLQPTKFSLLGAGSRQKLLFWLSTVVRLALKLALPPLQRHF